MVSPKFGLGLMLGSVQYSTAAVADAHSRVASWVSTNSADVLAYYPITDAGTATMADESGNGRDGTHNGGLPSGTFSTGELVDGGDYIPTGDYSGVADAAWMDDIRGGFAVIEADTTTGNDVIMCRFDVGGSLSWALWRLGTQLYLNTNDNATYNLTGGTIGTSQITVGWYANGTTTYLYVDGTQVNTVSAPAPQASAEPFRVGARFSSGSLDTSNTFDGIIASVVLLDASATTASVPAIHDAWVNA